MSIIHPYNQWQVVEFYDQYKYSILYLCNQSKYSLRKPHKIAQYFYYRDRLHSKLSGHESDKVELFFNEYENLKTFFSYEKYSNIYKFYEDYRYQRAEKKFKHLVKFDLQSCFDSIYTHTISWATAGGPDKVKVLPAYHGSWVGDAFDNLMQSVNARETNGIVIGPEFSRIFAEIILQYIDHRVEQELLEQSLCQKSNYECYRYVDDYFLFYNDENDRKTFMESLIKWLKEFKLQISPSKTEEFERGAELAFNICLFLKIKKAILKERSPSCGVHEVYDGSFSHKKIKGMGVTAQYLKEKGIIVYSEDEIPELLKED